MMGWLGRAKFPRSVHDSCYQLDNATSLCDFLFREFAEPSCAHDQWNFWESTLSKDLRVAEGLEIKNGDSVLLGGGEVLFALLGGDEGPELVEVDNRLPEEIALLVEVPHTDLSEVTWMVFIHVGSVMMLSTSKTSSTGMLAMLSYTTTTGRDMPAMLARV